MHPHSDHEKLSMSQSSISPGGDSDAIALRVPWVVYEKSQSSISPGGDSDTKYASEVETALQSRNPVLALEVILTLIQISRRRKSLNSRNPVLALEVILTRRIIR